ncbi:MAG: hypothetical protein V4722_01500 [Bacteroidota bacterium]
MKKLFFAAISVCLLLFSSCKNKGSETTSTSTSSTTTEVKNDGDQKTSDAPAFETATAYNDYIINRQRTIYDYIFKMSDATNSDMDSREKIIDEALPVIDKILGEVKAMPPFKGDVSFRDAAIELFGFYKTTFDKSYRAIIEINKKGAKKTKADQAMLQKISNEITQTEAGLDVAMKSAQKAFGSANGMMVQENTELQEKVDNMNKKDN